MSIPRDIAYDMPPAPATRAVPGWTLDPGRAALLVHDMQNHFVRAFRPDAEPITAAIANIDALRAWCARSAVPVFFTAQQGDQDARDRGLQSDFWGTGMRSGSEHAGIVDALTPHPDDLVLTKWRYSAFQRTPLEAMLHARGRDQLIVTGVYAHIGVLLTVADAFMRDIEPFMVVDAVADFSRARHDAAAEYVGGRCGALTTTARIIATGVRNG